MSSENKKTKKRKAESQKKQLIYDTKEAAKGREEGRGVGVLTV